MPDLTKNVEIPKYWTFNQTGNIMVSSTVQEEKELRDEVITEFQKVSVLYDAISTAIARKQRSYAFKDKDGNDHSVSLGLFDYAAISAVMASSGFFALMHEEDRTFEKESGGVSIDTALITDVLSAFSGAGPVMNIAKSVIHSMGGEAKKLSLPVDSSHKDVRIGHLLFILEDCMGMPLVNIQVISTSLDQITTHIKTNCAEANREKIAMEYKMETFMFIDPQYIAQFSHEFKVTDEFEDLITRLSGYIPGIPCVTGVLLDDVPVTGSLLRQKTYQLTGDSLGGSQGSLQFSGGVGTIKVSTWAPDKIEFQVTGPVTQAAAIEVHAPNNGASPIATSSEKYTVEA